MTKPSSVHLPEVAPRYRTQSTKNAAVDPAAGGTARPRSANTPAVRPHDAVTISDNRGRRGVSRPRYWLAGSSIVAGLLLMVDVGGIKQPAAESVVCQSADQSDAFLSRERLAGLMAIPERDSKEAVRQTVGEPYCTLPPVEVRAGVQAEREAYPLAFDSNAWVIVLYEGEEYAGYDFKFPND